MDTISFVVKISRLYDKYDLPRLGFVCDLWLRVERQLAETAYWRMDALSDVMMGDSDT